jgi:DNA-binding transcriptional ArsR family regulator
MTETPAALSDATRTFMRALASETRQDLMLLFSSEEELTVSEVAERSGLAASTTSEQLAILRRGGLLTSRRVGKQVRYRADRERIVGALEDLAAFLRRCC